MKYEKSELEKPRKKIRKNKAKSQPLHPFLVHVRVILLKQEIQRAESAIRSHINKSPLANIEAAIGHTTDAVTFCRMALQDGFLSVARIEQICESLVKAGRTMNIHEVMDAWHMACDLHNLMPPKVVKYGIPHYVIKEGVSIPCEVGAK